MPDYLVVRLIGGDVLYSSITESYGYVEVRPSKTDTPDERQALQSSLAANSENMNLDISMRLAIVIEDAVNIDEAHLLAESFFEEVIDVLTIESVSPQHPRLLASGFVRDYSNGELIYRRPVITFKQWPPMNAYKVTDGYCPQISLHQYILMSQRDNELCARFVRSTHWSRKALSEANLQLRILFNWFALEALWKVDENDDIVPKAMLSIGFPIGQMKSHINRTFLAKLENHTKYNSWKEVVLRWMEAIRSFRNVTVHSGYRMWDVEKSDIRKYNYAIGIACSLSGNFIKKGISMGHKSPSTVWNDAHLILPQMENIVNFVHGTLIYRLENRAWVTGVGA